MSRIRVTQANWEENEFVQQIWIAVVASGERYQLTSGKKSSQNPKWSPDSTRIAFLSERDGKRQIYLIRPRGGEAQQLTSEENGVDSMEWAPDGSAIAYSSTGPDTKAKKDRKEKYGEFDVIGGDYAMVRLWLVKTPGRNPRRRQSSGPRRNRSPKATSSASAISRGRPIPSTSLSAPRAIPISVPRGHVADLYRGPGGQAGKETAGFERVRTRGRAGRRMECRSLL